MAAAGVLLIPATVVLAGPSPQRTVRVRQAPGEPNGRSSQPSLSGDARFVAFSSAATNLSGAKDANGAVRDVFVFDQGSGIVRLASVGLDGAAADGSSTNPALDGDGGRLAFVSRATNLVAGDANAARDVFVLTTGAGITRVSEPATGGDADGPSSETDICADGHLVVFTSSATNLVAGDTNGHDDVFIRDLDTGAVELVSAGTEGAPADGDSAAPAISPDGRYVSFSSRASNLVDGDDDDRTDVFLRDLQAGTTELVSVARGGGGQDREFPGGAEQVSDVSNAGRFVVFESPARNLVRRDRNRSTDIFVRDRATHGTRRLSLSTTSEEGHGDSFLPSISPDGRYVAFASRADDLVPENADGLDYFVREVGRSATVLADATARGRPRGRELVEPDLERPVLSDDAQTVAFTSSASNLVGGDRNRRADVFLRRMGPPATATAGHAVGLLRGRLLIVFRSSDRAAEPLRCRLDDGPPTLCPLGGMLLPRLHRGRHILRAFAGATGSLYATSPIVIRMTIGKGRPRVRVRNPADDV
jgi:Tol biopolymer transport system component